MHTTPENRLTPIVDLLLTQAGDLQAPIAVLDDLGGELTETLVQRGHRPRVWCDDMRSEQLVPRHLRHETPLSAVTGARTVLWRLPRAVGAVEEYGELIAQYADQNVRVVAAGLNKQLSRSMNTALERSFAAVTASLGHRKCRALLASTPLAHKPSWPRRTHLASLELDVVAHGATFNTNRLDRGTALLLGCFDQLPPAETAIDLGCGSGILGTLLARRGARVHAIDVAWTATDAARRTAQANGVMMDVSRRDGLLGWTGLVDLIITNPPFHVGSAKDTTPTRSLFAQARKVLVDGGELWCVYNTHLPYLQWLRELIGPTSIILRDRSYLVTRTVRRSLESSFRRTSVRHEKAL